MYFIVLHIVNLDYCCVDIMQYNAMHKFVRVLDSPPVPSQRMLIFLFLRSTSIVMRVKTAPCAISQLYFNTKYGHYKMVQNYDLIELTIAIITSSPLTK